MSVIGIPDCTVSSTVGSHSDQGVVLMERRRVDE